MTSPVGATEALRARLGHESAMQAKRGDVHLSALLDEAVLALAQQASVPTALAQRVQDALSMPACDRLRHWAAIGPVQLAAVEALAEMVLMWERGAVAWAGVDAQALRDGRSER